MKATEHGGNLFTLAQKAQCHPKDILDFSVNLRPEGAPPFLKEALLNAMEALHAYPSPYAEEACLAASTYYARHAQCFVFGNGSNELIHAAARFFAQQGKKHAYIVEPAFSEYALACKNAGLETHSLWGGVHAQDDATFHALLQTIPQGSLLFMANPANPSGIFYAREQMCTFIRMRPDLIWIIDEAFIEYAGEEHLVSLTRLAATELAPNVLVLRSLTKFHALAGARLGFLLSTEAMAQGIRKTLPAWTVNCFAMQAALAVFADTSDFAKQTRHENTKRRNHLIKELQHIKNIEVFPSVANYVLFRHKGAPHNLPQTLLQQYHMAIRDCSNYYGLEDNTWYRVAVRFPHEHTRLCKALKILFDTTTKKDTIRHY